MAGSPSRSVKDAVGNWQRQCPTLPGELRSLITHKIERGLCQQRQREYYHKCHRCVYRGKPTDWVFEAQPSQRSLNGTNREGRPVPGRKA